MISMILWIAMWMGGGQTAGKKPKVDEAYRARVEALFNKTSQGTPVEVYRRGEKLAVVGHTGTGSLVLMVLEPQEGDSEMVLTKGPLVCKP